MIESVGFHLDRRRFAPSPLKKPRDAFSLGLLARGRDDMDGFTLLSLLSLAMFFGSYLSGSVPLAMSFSEVCPLLSFFLSIRAMFRYFQSKLRFVSIFGAGLLVGTALAVIIPEGVQSIYEADTGEFLSLSFSIVYQVLLPLLSSDLTCILSFSLPHPALIPVPKFTRGIFYFAA